MSTKVTIDVTLAVERLGADEFRRRFGNRQRPKLAERVTFINHPEIPIGTGHIVCPRCLHFNRTVWRTDDISRPIPPIHERCYCELVPTLPGPALRVPAELDPPLKQGVFLQRKIRSLNTASLTRVLGKGRAKLAKAGLINADDLVTKPGGLATLETLLQRLGMTADDLNLSQAGLRRKFSGAVKTATDTAPTN